MYIYIYIYIYNIGVELGHRSLIQFYGLDSGELQ